MKPQFGVCKNKAGCSLAYTGEKIQVPADLKCPECGQPLVVESAKPGGAKVLLIAVGLLLVLIGGAVVLFAFKDEILRLAFQMTDNSPKVIETHDTNGGSTPAVVQEPSATPANSPSAASTPVPSEPPADLTVTPPAETPSPLSSPTAEQETPQPVIGPVATPAVQESTPNTTPNQTPPVDNSNASANNPANAGGEIQPPVAPTKPEVDATREDVLKRINAMPKFTDEEKKRLTEKMETARSMDLLIVIRFDTGQTDLSRVATEQLLTRIKSKDVQDKLSDPTVVFVVAGYADAAGDPKTNLSISQQRADNVAKVLKVKTDLVNVIDSVGMGSTDLLDGKRSGQNRAVEVWAVAP